MIERCTYAAWVVTVVLTVSPMPGFSGGALAERTVGFEPNRGQFQGSMRYVVRTREYLLALGCGGEATYGLPGLGPVAAIRMSLEGKEGCQDGQGEFPLGSSTHYYAGAEKEAWHTDIPHYGGVRFREVYRGVDMVWRARGAQVEYAFHVAGGVDTDRIRLRFEGVTDIRLDGSGNLLLETSDGVIKHHRPVAYQLSGRERREIPVQYAIAGGLVGFMLPERDARFPVVIDPTITYASYLGGTGWDAGYGIAADNAGNVYITGDTASSDFLRPPGFARGNRDVFVCKLSASGTLLYTTILASSGNDAGRAIAVDAAGNVYVAGVAAAGDFPVTTGAYSTTWGGAEDAFVARLDSAGQVVFATYLGSGGSDAANGLALDPAGNVYVAGYTNSLNFPTAAGAPQASFRGGAHDAFLAKLNNTGNVLVYSTLLGGIGNDLAYAVAVDASGQACIAGSTDSGGLPVRNAVQASLAKGSDVMVACLNPAGTAWNLLTYLGGMGNETAYGIALDGSGIYVTGTTYSLDFPVTAGAAQPGRQGDYDVFVAKLSATLPTLIYATYLGGTGSETGTGIAVDGIGQAWVAGYTTSVDFPQYNAVQTGLQGGFDAFLTEISRDGTAVLFSTLLGGPAEDRATGLALDGNQGVWLTGYTGSTTFPVTAGALQPTAPQPYNAFAVRIQRGANQSPAAVSVAPASGSGLNQLFTFTFTDADGAADISWTEMIFNTSVGATGGCHIHFTRALNQLGLFNDAGTAMNGPVVPGQNMAVQNSQCILNGAASSAITNGNSLTVSISLTFQPSFGGQMNTYLYAMDSAGATSNWQTRGAWVVPSPPSAASVSPAWGSGSMQLFSFTFTDANGATDISWTQVIFNASLTGVGGCYIHYGRAANLFFLYNDTVTGLLGPVAPGQAASLQNSQCSLNGGASSVSAVGNTLTLNISLTFQPAFGGGKNVYMYAQDSTNTSSNWQTRGSWSVPGGVNQPPSVVSVSPGAGSGSSQLFTFTFADANGGPDISWTQMIVNSALTGMGGCYIHYDRPQNLLFLYTDGVTGLIGPVSPGQSRVIENSQCSIDAGGSAVLATGNTLRISLAISFKAAFSGAKNVYMFACDNANAYSNWQAAGSWFVPGAVNGPPAAVAVSPASGSGSSQLFSFSFSDPNGGIDISWTQMIVNGTLTGAGGCYIHYSRSQNQLWLYNDTVTGVAGPISPGQNAVLQNSQCGLNGAVSSVSVAGNTLAVNVSLTFRPAFAGLKNIYLYAQDNGGGASNWRGLGTWTAQ